MAIFSLSTTSYSPLELEALRVYMARRTVRPGNTVSLGCANRPCGHKRRDKKKSVARSITISANIVPPPPPSGRPPIQYRSTRTLKLIITGYCFLAHGHDSRVSEEMQIWNYHSLSQAERQRRATQLNATLGAALIQNLRTRTRGDCHVSFRPSVPPFMDVFFVPPCDRRVNRY